jgi:hypothetical protein
MSLVDTLNLNDQLHPNDQHELSSQLCVVCSRDSADRT